MNYHMLRSTDYMHLQIDHAATVTKLVALRVWSVHSPSTGSCSCLQVTRASSSPHPSPDTIPHVWL